VRIQRLPRAPATAIASASPNTISITTETATNTNVLMIAGRRTSSVRSVSKLRFGVNVHTSVACVNSTVETLIRTRFSSG
jgi:hypothetical protein